MPGKFNWNEFAVFLLYFFVKEIAVSTSPLPFLRQVCFANIKSKRKCPRGCVSCMYMQNTPKTKHFKTENTQCTMLKTQEKRRNLIRLLSAWIFKKTQTPQTKQTKSQKLIICTQILCLCRRYLWILAVKGKKLNANTTVSFTDCMKSSAAGEGVFYFGRRRWIHVCGRYFPLPVMYIKDICWQTLSILCRGCQWTIKMS